MKWVYQQALERSAKYGIPVGEREMQTTMDRRVAIDLGAPWFHLFRFDNLLSLL